MNFPTRTELAQLFNEYVLANSPLTTVNPYSGLQALANAGAAQGNRFYRDLLVAYNQYVVQGLYALFDFSPLSPTTASAPLNCMGTPGSPIPANTTVSNTGSAGTPAVSFSVQTAVSLLAADPTTAPTLTQAAGASTFTLNEAVYVGYAWTNSNTSGSTFASPVLSANIAAAGNTVATTLTFPAGADGVNILVGNTAQPDVLANVSSGGTITYSGSATSGIAVSVGSGTVTVTISAVAASDGSPYPTVSSAGQAQTTIAAVLAGASGNVPAGTITNIVTPVNGLVSVYNPQAATGGADEESISAQQQRWTTYRNSLSRGTTAALGTGALGTSGVSKAKAVVRAYLTVQVQQVNSWNDYSTETNRPKGVPVNPYANTMAVGDAVYIGANRRFTELYFDVSTAGANYTVTWQYLNSAGTWANLTVTLDQTSGGLQSGTVAWDLPTDWAQGTVNSVQQFWVRLSTASVNVPTAPGWYQVMTLDPPPGYANLYILPQGGVSAATVLANVANTMSSWRANGIEVTVDQVTTQVLNITLSVVPTAYGQTLALATAIQNAVTALISNLQIGQDLPLSDIYYAVTSLYAGQAVSEVQIVLPTADILPDVSTLIVAGTILVNIVTPVS